MSADRIGSPGGGPSRVVAGETPYPGRIDVKERALRKVAEEASATTIGVNRSEVSVEVSEYAGGIALRLSTPLPIPDLDDSAAIASATPVIERAGQLQEQLRDRISHLTGREVARINITITGATVPTKRRVR